MKNQIFESYSTPNFTDTENVEDLQFDWFEEHVQGLTKWWMPMLNLLDFHIQDEEKHIKN